MVSICLPPDLLFFWGGSHKPDCASPCVQVSPVTTFSPLKLKPQTDTHLHSGESVGPPESTFVQRSSLGRFALNPLNVMEAHECHACQRPSRPREIRRVGLRSQLICVEIYS